MRVLIRTFAVLLLGLVLAGCCDECPVCPEPEPESTPDYHLLFSWANPEFVWKTYILSSATNTYIDSTIWPDQPPGQYLYTRDGRYLIYADGGMTNQLYCADAESGDTISTVPFRFSDLSVSPDGSLLAGGKNFRIMSVPSLSTIFEDTVEVWDNAFNRAGTRVYGCDYTHAGIVAYDLSGPTISAEYWPSKDSRGNNAFVRVLATTADDSKLLLGTGGSLGPFYFHVVDTDSFQVISEYSMQWPLTFITVHPDGKRAFLGYYGLWEMYNHGTIWEYDIENDVLTRYLDKDDIYAPDYSWPIVAPTDMVILPDGKRAYVVNACNPFGKDSGPFIVINLKTDRVIELIGLPPMSQLEHLVLNPVDWSKKGR